MQLLQERKRKREREREKKPEIILLHGLRAIEKAIELTDKKKENLRS